MAEPEPAAPLPAPVPSAPVDPEAAQAAEVLDFRAQLKAAMPRAWVTYGLVAVNVAIFAAMAAGGVNMILPDAIQLLPWGADFGPRTLGGQPWRLLTSAFVHFGVIHVGLNMLVLARAGQLVERLYGSVRFAALYLVAALTGGMASLAVHPYLVSAGASGAVFGVYGALAAFLWRRRGAVPAAVVKKMGNMALGFLGANLALGFQSSLVDNAAHIGGLLGGALSGALLAPAFVAGVAPRGGRGRAALALGIAAAAGLAVTSLLPRPFDFLAEITAFADAEHKAVSTFSGFVQQARAQQLSDNRFADWVEGQVLPTWRAARLRLASRGPWPEDKKPLQAAYLGYATAREGLWEEMAKALHDHDAAAVRAVSEKHGQAVAAFRSRMEQLGK